jgi:hypothetical protein
MSDYKDVKDFFDKNIKIKIDKKLINELRMFRLRWSTKSDEYIEFLGSNLTGVHSIRFSTLDDNMLMNDIFLINDIDKLQKDFYNVKGIEKRFKVGANVIYHLLVYVTRRILKDNSLNKDLKETGMKEAILIMEYKMFASLYAHYFKYNVEENIAVTVYEKLSYKFILKRLNSWGELFNYRTDDVLDKQSPTYSKILRYTTEDAVRAVTAIQTKIRAGLLTIYGVLIEVKNNKEYITGDGLTYIGGDNNEKQIKDVGGSSSDYTNNIRQIKYSAPDFVDNDIVTIVNNIYDTLDKDILHDLLISMCNETLHKKIKIKLKRYKKEKDHYDAVLVDILSISFEYLQRLNINISDRSNIPESLVLLKNYWSSSKVNNKKMDDIKRYLRDMTIVLSGRKTKWVVTTLVLSFTLYVYLRSLKKNNN